MGDSAAAPNDGLSPATGAEPLPQLLPLRSRKLPVLCALALAVLHFLWLAAHLAPATMSPDANGYVVQARLIANEGRTSFTTTSPVQFVGMHWLETTPGVFHSRYPAGLPVLFAAAWKMGGLPLALFINPLLASATVFLVFLLACRIVSKPYALLAAVVIATIPVANQHALDADAHVAATFFLLAGTLALLRFDDTRMRRWGLLAGFLLGAVPTIRYPEAIVGITVGGWLLWRVRPIWRVWPAVVGAAFPIGALLVHNTSAYGAFWRTGYALTNEQTGFGLSYFVSHVLPYLQALSGQGLALIFAFGVAGLAAMIVDARRRAEGVLFVGFVVPLVLLYMAYYFGGGGIGGAGGNLRFVVPTFPYFAVAAVWLLASVAKQLGMAGRVAVIAVAALQLLVSIGASMQTLAQAKTALVAAARARAVAAKEIPAGSVVIVDRQLAESLDAVGQWKLVEESLVGGGPLGMGGPGGFMPGGFGPPGGFNPGGRGGMAGGAGRGGAFRTPSPGDGPEPSDQNGAAAPSPQQAGKNRAQRERYAGLDPTERRERVWSDIAAWADGKPVFWFARSLDAVDVALPTGADYRSIAEVDAPMMMVPGGGGGPGPMPGGPPGGFTGRGGRGAPGRGMGGGGFGPPGGMTSNIGRGRRGNAAGSNATLRVVQIQFAKP